MDLIIQKLSKSYGNQAVLTDFSCTIQAGFCTALMGPSGCGKTTLLRLIAGLETPDSGSIRYPDGSDVPPRISMVFQENRLCPDFDAATNLLLVLPDLSAKEIRTAFAQVRLTDWEQKPVRELSGGMQRRVAIVRAILVAKHAAFGKADDSSKSYGTAPLVLLDEPLKGLDPELYLIVRDYLQISLTGITTLLVTHSPEEAKFFGKELLLL